MLAETFLLHTSPIIKQLHRSVLNLSSASSIDRCAGEDSFNCENMKHAL
jgi:hypothetical protein